MSTITPNTLTVTLMQGDDLEQIRDMYAKLNLATTMARLAANDELPVPEAPKRVAPAGPGVLEQAQEIDAFIVEAAERAFKVKIDALSRTPWKHAREAHPPLPGNEDHATYGFNSDTIGEDIVPAGIVEITRNGKPEPTKGAELDSFLESLSDGQWNKLASAAIIANTDSREDPKPELSSRLTPIYGAMESSPEDSD